MLLDVCACYTWTLLVEAPPSPATRSSAHFVPCLIASDGLSNLAFSGMNPIENKLARWWKYQNSGLFILVRSSIKQAGWNFACLRRFWRRKLVFVIFLLFFSSPGAIIQMWIFIRPDLYARCASAADFMAFWPTVETFCRFWWAPTEPYGGVIFHFYA